MRGKWKIAVAMALLAVAAGGQFLLRRARSAAVPAVAESAFAAIGGLRSIAAEVLWFRLDRLQDEGLYVELAQLASALTLMEPHTPEVWSYAAWNLAYNVSVMMPTPDDRWRWVEAAIRLLRDEGLVINPQEPELYRELAWLFELKIGANIDSASPVYRERWREIVDDVKSRGAWKELGMDPMQMLEVERVTGFDDWGDPQMSAIYWAKQGLDTPAGKRYPILESILLQSQIIYRKNHRKNLCEVKKS